VGILHQGKRFHKNFKLARKHGERLFNHFASLLQDARILIGDVDLIRCDCSGLASSSGGSWFVEELTLHRCESLLFLFLELLEGAIDIIFDPAHILLGRVAKRENIFHVRKHVIFEILIRGRCN